MSYSWQIPQSSTNENIPNGQLMHLALEVVSKVAESPQDIDQRRDFAYDIKNSILPPVCAL